MKLNIVYIALVFISFKGYAQDPVFTQAVFVPEILNPGFTGFEDDERYHAGMLSRLQWPGLDSRINTQYFFLNRSFNTGGFNENTLGVGVNAQWQYETFNDYNFFLFNASFSYRIKIDSGMYIRPGIEAGAGNKSNRFRNLTLGDQININTGVINPVTVDPSGLFTTSPIYFDMAAGVVFERLVGRDLQYWVGFSMRHLTQPDISFIQGAVEPLDLFFSLHGSYRFDFLRGDSVFINGNYMRQNDVDRLDIGPMFELDRFLVGATATTNPSRSNPDRHLLTSINGFFGIEYSRFRFGVSYDYNLSKLGNTRGVYELSITYLSPCNDCDWDRGRKR